MVTKKKWRVKTLSTALRGDNFEAMRTLSIIEKHLTGLKRLLGTPNSLTKQEQFDEFVDEMTSLFTIAGLVVEEGVEKFDESPYLVWRFLLLTGRVELGISQFEKCFQVASGDDEEIDRNDLKSLMENIQNYKLSTAQQERINLMIRAYERHYNKVLSF